MPYVEVADCRLHYEASGDGPPIVFVHESAADARQWRGQMAAFSGRYRCIAYDARGYLPSDVPERDEDYGYEQAWRDLAAVVEQVAGGPAHIVGLSMGAYAGLMLALHRPELVRSLTFAGGGTGSTRQPDGILRERMEALAQVFLREGSAAAAARIAAHPNREGFRRRDLQGWQAWYDDLCDHSALGMALTYRNYQGLRPSLYDYEQKLRGLDVPVLLCVGDEDPACLEINLFLKQILPDAALWMTPHSGHAVNLEAPDAFNFMVGRFIDRIERSAG